MYLHVCFPVCNLDIYIYIYGERERERERERESILYYIFFIFLILYSLFVTCYPMKLQNDSMLF